MDQALELDPTRCAGFIPVYWSPLTNCSVALCWIILMGKGFPYIYPEFPAFPFLSHPSTGHLWGKAHAWWPGHAGVLHGVVSVCPHPSGSSLGSPAVLSRGEGSPPSAPFYNSVTPWGQRQCWFPDRVETTGMFLCSSHNPYVRMLRNNCAVSSKMFLQALLESRD